MTKTDREISVDLIKARLDLIQVGASTVVLGQNVTRWGADRFELVTMTRRPENQLTLDAAAEKFVGVSK